MTTVRVVCMRDVSFSLPSHACLNTQKDTKKNMKKRLNNDFETKEFANVAVNFKFNQNSA